MNDRFRRPKSDFRNRGFVCCLVENGVHGRDGFPAGADGRGG